MQIIKFNTEYRLIAKVTAKFHNLDLELSKALSNDELSIIHCCMSLCKILNVYSHKLASLH